MALEHKDKIKDLFSSKLQNFEAEVPASIWQGIDQSLSQPAVAPKAASTAATRTATTIKALWLKVAAAAAAVVAITTVGVISLSDKNEGVGTTTFSALIVDDVIKLPADTVRMEEGPIAPEKTMATTTYARRARLPEATQKKEIKGQKNIPEIDDIPIDEVKKPDDMLIVKNKTTEEPITITLNNRPAAGVMVGFLSNVDLYSNTQKQQGKVLSFSDAEPLDQALCYGDNLFKMEHDRPISFGFTISKGLSRDLSLETGLVYTYLSSSIRSDNYYKLREKQKFHYLGIPISLNYTFLRYKKMESYIALGGMVQKDIYGTYNGELGQSFINESENGNFFEQLRSSKKSIHQNKLQFSTHFNLGVSYPLYRRLHLYGTFGGAYHFDASNKYRTIYSDKEFQLDLNLGVKWKF